MLFNEVIAFDHYRQKVFLITGVMTDDLDKSYKRACEKLEEMTKLIKKGEKDVYKRQSLNAVRSCKMAISITTITEMPKQNLSTFRMAEKKR